jgi:hypothetical protein
VAAQAEHLRHFFLDQVVDNDLGTIEHITRRHRNSVVILRCSPQRGEPRRIAASDTSCSWPSFETPRTQDARLLLR